MKERRKGITHFPGHPTDQRQACSSTINRTSSGYANTAALRMRRLERHHMWCVVTPIDTAYAVACWLGSVRYVRRSHPPLSRIGTLTRGPVAKGTRAQSRGEEIDKYVSSPSGLVEHVFFLFLCGKKKQVMRQEIFQHTMVHKAR